MTRDASAEDERRRYFREAALPYLDDVYAFARSLMRNQADAEDAVQQCYLQASEHFDACRGSAMKPWLLAILRKICFAALARHERRELPGDHLNRKPAAEDNSWQAPRATALRQLVDALPEESREVIVLRERNSLSYREIAAVTGTPVGTVMVRLARARTLLLAAVKGTDPARERRADTPALRVASAR